MILESDCLKLVQAMDTVDEDNSGFGIVVEDIRQLMTSLVSSYFAHVYRESNSAAHKIAKFALNAGVSYRWIGSVPNELQGFPAFSCIL